jgi:hypothetical protein
MKLSPQNMLRIQLLISALPFFMLGGNKINAPHFPLFQFSMNQSYKNNVKTVPKICSYSLGKLFFNEAHTFWVTFSNLLRHKTVFKPKLINKTYKHGYF